MIPEEKAVELAKAAAAELGWPWTEPTQAVLYRGWFGRGGRWEIRSNAVGYGAMVRMTVDAETGEIRDKGFVPR